ncbi:MAG: hypothetical protein ACRC06_14675, partial [Waterburya sp.]
GNCNAPPHHRRSLSQTTMFRLKCIFGGKVSSRSFENQVTELLIQCSVFNRIIQIAKPFKPMPLTYILRHNFLTSGG